MSQAIGKYLIILGVLIFVVGLIFVTIGKTMPFGKLPGDILIKKENFALYFPITTCLLISIILSVIFYLFFRK